GSKTRSAKVGRNESPAARLSEPRVVRKDGIAVPRGNKMSSRTRAGNNRDVYLDLVLRFPLRPIRSDEELDEAIQVIDSLVDREQLVQEEKDYLDVLSDLVERYEAEAHPIEPVSDDVLLRHLMEAKQVTQSETARGTGIAVSTISE